MLLTNQHLNKIATCHADFTSHGMLDDTLISGSNSYKLSYKMLTTVLLIKMMKMMMEETILDHPYLLKLYWQSVQVSITDYKYASN